MQYPVWIKDLRVKTTINAWKIEITSNTFDCNTLPKTKTVYISKDIEQQQAITQAILRALDVKLWARGCWIVSQVKSKYGADPAGRRELFGSYCRMLKMKYDGIKSYLYESADAQDEIIKALVLSDMPDEISLDIPEESDMIPA